MTLDDAGALISTLSVHRFGTAPGRPIPLRWRSSCGLLPMCWTGASRVRTT